LIRSAAGVGAALGVDAVREQLHRRRQAARRARIGTGADDAGDVRAVPDAVVENRIVGLVVHEVGAAGQIEPWMRADAAVDHGDGDAGAVRRLSGGVERPQAIGRGGIERHTFEEVLALLLRGHMGRPPEARIGHHLDAGHLVARRQQEARRAALVGLALGAGRRLGLEIGQQRHRRAFDRLALLIADLDDDRLAAADAGHGRGRDRRQVEPRERHARAALGDELNVGVFLEDAQALIVRHRDEHRLAADPRRHLFGANAREPRRHVEALVGQKDVLLHGPPPLRCHGRSLSLCKPPVQLCDRKAEGKTAPS
jgi:hypothetical protein